ncbi:cysteine peptidase family C39 domain-containing protein [Mesoplasma chauliocola]|uniref:cysteine peptidase family C39 domain-containing protein n=1 Tax=Mesoplasma chauliocola TaxID=216427 RepID=UPI000484FC04|nr:cysteine peptidase family C39 domain-containing protein [Mesoplasma chauliocola]
MKLIKQTSYQDCGIACLAMLINHFYNYEIDLHQIKLHLNMEDEELSFYDLIDLSSLFYLKAEGFKIDFDLEEMITKTPFLAQVVNEEGMLHFVIVSELKNNNFIIFDPSKSNKIKLNKQQFLKIFSGYVLIFKANKIKFKNEFNFKISSLKRIISFEIISYILVSLLTTVLFMIDTQFLKLYANSLMNEKQDWFLYLLLLVILIINIIFKSVNNYILRKNYEKKLLINLDEFLDIVSKSNNKELFYLYQDIKWVTKFENYKLVLCLCSLISELLNLVFIFFAIKELFFVILIGDLIYIFFNYFITKFKSNEYGNSDRQWFIMLNNLENIKNEGNEKVTYLNLKKEITSEQSFEINSNFLEIWDKVSLILIYIVCWSLIKEKTLDFSMFFILLLLKNFSRINVYSIGQTLLLFKKYKIAFINYERVNLKSKLIPLKDSINNISIKKISKSETSKINLGINILEQKLELGILNKTHKDFDYDVFFNNINIENLEDISLREHINYLKNYKVKFGTIYQNIALVSNLKVNIFKLNVVINLIEKYSINISKLIKPESCTQVEKEIIKLLSIFYLEKKVILVKNNFEIITFDEIKAILKEFTKLNNDKFVILS